MTRLAVLTVVVASAAVPASSGNASDEPLRRHKNPAGWRIDFPASWYLERSAHRCFQAVGQATVATFPMGRAVRGYRTKISCGFSVRPPLDAHGVFPPDGVALRVLCTTRGVLELAYRPVFPLTLDQLQLQTPYETTSAAPQPRALVIRHHWVPYAVSAWVGERATPAALAALERALASLRFMRARPRPGGLRRCEPK